MGRIIVAVSYDTLLCKSPSDIGRGFVQMRMTHIFGILGGMAMSYDADLLLTAAVVRRGIGMARHG